MVAVVEESLDDFRQHFRHADRNAHHREQPAWGIRLRRWAASGRGRGESGSGEEESATQEGEAQVKQRGEGGAKSQNYNRTLTNKIPNPKHRQTTTQTMQINCTIEQEHTSMQCFGISSTLSTVKSIITVLAAHAYYIFSNTTLGPSRYALTPPLLFEVLLQPGDS